MYPYSLFSWILLAIVIAVVYLYLSYRRAKFRKFQQTCYHIKSLDGTCKFDYSSEVIVVGAGILGSSLATVLAREGRKVVLIERDFSEPDRIVGELLQPGGYAALKRLGLETALEGIDYHTVYGYVIHDKDSESSVSLGYPIDSRGVTQTGRSFHHGRFVMGLRRLALDEPNITAIEGTVQLLLEDKDNVIIGVQYRDKKTSQIKTVKADITFVADGCFSKFRKDLVASSVAVHSNFVGVIMHDAPQYKSGHAEIVLGSSGPVLIYQISSTSTRILVDVPGKLPADMKKYMLDRTAPELPEYIYQPFVKAVENDQLRSMPNSFLPPFPNSKQGVAILGDAYNMRHPLTGAGMSVALNDVLLLRQLLHDIPYLNQHDLVECALKNFQWKRKMSHSFVVNILAQALYALFASSEGHTNELRRSCFKYFKLGGQAVSGPVGLLLKPYPSVLIGHFFAVAFYAIWQTSSKYTVSLKPHIAVYKSFMILYNACAIIFPLIYSELESLIF